jgi:hypothetical protein
MNAFRILNNQVHVITAGSTNGGQAYWNSASFGTDQEAYFTFTQVSPTATEQGVLLKYSGTTPSSSNAALIKVVYDPTTNTVVVSTKVAGQGFTPQLTIPAITLAAGDQMGARALADGTVLVFQNGTQIGSVVISSGGDPARAALLAGGGKIGAWFTGTVFTSPNDAFFDNFGGGTVP